MQQCEHVGCPFPDSSTEPFSDQRRSVAQSRPTPVLSATLPLLLLILDADSTYELARCPAACGNLSPDNHHYRLGTYFTRR